MSLVKIFFLPGSVTPVPVIFLLLAICSSSTFAKDSWKNVDRIVAIGDIHGDYEQFHKVLVMAKIIDERGRWIAGKTHLVQTGDIPDRGPDSLKIIRELLALEKSARRARGYVHLLIGNHEAMNVYGDLRYVHQGEYQVLIDKKSLDRQADYYKKFITYLAANDSEMVFDDVFKKEWMARYPLGYVEHRLIWEARGEIGKLITRHNAVIKINDTLFLHGGLNPHLPFRSISDINKSISRDLKQSPLPDGSLVDAEDGPLWYRGLAQNPAETELPPLIDMLKFYKANHIVIGHSPTRGVINPRFDSRVIVIDVGLASHYGAGMAALLIEDGQLSANHRGTIVPLPKTDKALKSYFQQIAPLEPSPQAVKNIIHQLDLLEHPPAPEPARDDKTEIPAEAMTE